MDAREPLMSAFLETVAREVARVLATVDDEQLAVARRLIVSTKGAVTTTGQGRSGLVAAMAAMRFMHLGIPAHVAGESTAPAIGADDLLLVVSGSGRTPVSLLFARTAREQRASVVALTRDPDSEISRLADHVVMIPATGSEQLGGNLFEQTSLLVLDAIACDIGQTISNAPALLRARHANLI
jgi:6-phospho-3-hexuloisomerase